MGAAYPELVAHQPSILKWVRGEEEGFGRTLEQGTKLLDDLIEAGRGGRRRTPSSCTTRSASRSS